MTGRTEIVLILQLMLDLSKVAFEPHVLPSTSCVYAQSGVNTYGSLSIKGGGGTPFWGHQWTGPVSHTALDLTSDCLPVRKLDFKDRSIDVNGHREWATPAFNKMGTLLLLLLFKMAFLQSGPHSGCHPPASLWVRAWVNRLGCPQQHKGSTGHRGSHVALLTSTFRVWSTDI